MIITKKKFAKKFKFCPVFTELKSLKKIKGTTLLSIFGPIIPLSILKNFKYCINFHPGTPNYPGRDPHHWALYENAKYFGVTIHFMNEKVDSGKIIYVKKFKIQTCSPKKLMNTTNKLAINMMNEMGLNFIKKKITIKKKIKWLGKKRTRNEILLKAKETKHFAFKGFC